MKLGYPEQHLNNPLFIFIVNIKSQAEINEKWLKLFSMKDKAQTVNIEIKNEQLERLSSYIYLGTNNVRKWHM